MLFFLFYINYNHFAIILQLQNSLIQAKKNVHFYTQMSHRTLTNTNKNKILVRLNYHCDIHKQAKCEASGIRTSKIPQSCFEKMSLKIFSSRLKTREN